MLVLTRKLQEQVSIGQDITITVLRVKGNSIRIGIDAPDNVRVLRGELTRHDTACSAAHKPGNVNSVRRDAVHSDRSADDFERACESRPQLKAPYERSKAVALKSVVERVGQRHRVGCTSPATTP